MRLESMQDVFINQLRDVLSAEKQLTKALPKMAKAAKSPALATAFEAHLVETEEQIVRLEQVFESVGKKASAKHCHGMEGLLKEGDEAIKAEGEDALVDTEIIAAAQRVEHYEIAAYGCLVQYAEMMGLTEAAELLTLSLEEEKAADTKLTQINETEISASALAAGMAGVGAEGKESAGSMGSSSASVSSRSGLSGSARSVAGTVEGGTASSGRTRSGGAGARGGSKGAQSSKDRK